MPTPVINQTITPDYLAMTLAQLRAEWLRLAVVVQLGQNQRNEISDEMRRRQALAWAQNKVASLTEAEKDALRDVLGPPA